MMVLALTEPGKMERRVGEKLRSYVLSEIEKRSMDEGDLAEVLGLFPVAARKLVERESWSLETGIRVAESLGLDL